MWRASYLTFFSWSRPDLLLAGTLALVLAGRWVSLKESNVTGVIFDLFFMIKTRSVLAGKLALVLAGGWVSLKVSNVRVSQGVIYLTSVSWSRPDLPKRYREKRGKVSMTKELCHPSVFLTLFGGGHTSLLHTKSKKIMAPGFPNSLLSKESKVTPLYPPPILCPNILPL